MLSKSNLITYRAGNTSFHPLEYAGEVKVMVTLGYDFGIISIIL